MSVYENESEPIAVVFTFIEFYDLAVCGYFKVIIIMISELFVVTFNDAFKTCCSVRKLPYTNYNYIKFIDILAVKF